jgi:hypothetical protein
MDRHPDTWVAERLADLTPTWTPDLARARRLAEAGPPRVRHTRVYGLAAATACVLAVAVLLPQGRALAQDLWYRLLVTRVAVVRLDLSRVPLDTSIRTDGLQQPVANLDEAEAHAGFRPSLPPQDVLAHAPALSVTGPIEITQRVQARALAASLAQQGVTDLEVPDAWEGVTLRGRIGPLVVADYGEDVQIVQAPPFQLDLPSGFPLARFAEAVFRAGGLSWWEARRFGEEFAARPAWLLDIADDEAAVIETIQLPTGEALLVEDADEGQTRATIIVSRPSRIYTVSSPTRALSLQLAAALR